MVSQKEKDIIKYLRDKLVKEIDRAGEEIIDHGMVSSDNAMDKAFQVYRSCIFERTISLDTLSDMDRNIK